MNFLGRLSIGAKLLLAPVVALALLLTLAATSYYGLQRQHKALSDIYQERFKNFKLASNSANRARETYGELFHLISSGASGNPSYIVEEKQKQVVARMKDISDRLAEMADNTNVSEEEMALIRDTVKQFLVYQKSNTEVGEAAVKD